MTAAVVCRVSREEFAISIYETRLRNLYTGCKNRGYDITSRCHSAVLAARVISGDPGSPVISRDGHYEREIMAKFDESAENFIYLEPDLFHGAMRKLCSASG